MNYTYFSNTVRQNQVCPSTSKLLYLLVEEEPHILMERIYTHNLMIHTEPNLLQGNEVNHKSKIFTIYLFVIL